VAIRVTRWIGQKFADYFAKIALSVAFFEHLTFLLKSSPFCHHFKIRLVTLLAIP
jgi:hypothetical protein